MVEREGDGRVEQVCERRKWFIEIKDVNHFKPVKACFPGQPKMITV